MKYYYPEHKKRVYYAQNREDLILSAFFSDVDSGFYVDVGAYDPDDDSVTRLFYENGWKGINIEPQPDRIGAFHDRRPNDINLGIGVSDKKGTLKLRSYRNQGLSTFQEKVKQKYQRKAYTSKQTEVYSDLEVEVKRLDEILGEHKANHINFLKVDVEGYEYEVLKGNDWNRFRPEVICIESNNKIKDWSSILESNGYGLVFNDGLNDYYVDLNSSKRNHFEYVRVVLTEKGGGLKYDDYMHIEGLRSDVELYKRLHSKTQDTLGKEIRMLRKQNEIQNRQYNSVKATASRLVYLLSSRLQQRLGRNKKSGRSTT